MNSCKNPCHPCGRDSYQKEMPLAMAYVPWQRWREIYQPDEGLSCGTIFKELNLTFTERRVCR